MSVSFPRPAGRWHIITCEYPPQLGGVSDYTRMVARGLAQQGDEVHVWPPRVTLTRPSDPGVVLHDAAGKFSRADLRALDIELDRFERPRRLLVQWVPHGYGYWSMNVGFCLWLLRRARVHGDRVDVVVHEVYLPFRRRRVKQNVAAAVHRGMAALLLQAATQVWYSIPVWEQRLKPYALGKRVRSGWLPLPSTIPVFVDQNAADATRVRYATPPQMLIGHFGTFGADVRELVVRTLASIPAGSPEYAVLLIGPGGDEAARQLVQLRPEMSNRVHATGPIRPDHAPPYLAACDIMLQPYTDGVSSRRTSFMAGLALGKAMITTLGEASEPLWKESGAAVFGSPDEPADLGRALGDLMVDAKGRARLGKTAQALYMARFDISHVIETLRAS